MKKSLLSLLLIIFLIQLSNFIKCEEEYFNDLRFTKSININNTGIEYGEVGLDHRILPVWDQVYNPGEGVSISIVSDGIYFNHTEIKANVNFNLSHNYLPGQNSSDLWPNTGSEPLGSHIAGILAMTANNSECSAGIAYNATIISRTIYNNTYLAEDEVIAQALYDTGRYNETQIDIVVFEFDLGNCIDILTCNFLPDKPLLHEAIKAGTEVGRDGRGIFYISPLQEEVLGNTNKYPTNKWREVCIVAPITHQGRQMDHNEEGSNIMFSGVVLYGDTKGLPTIQLDVDSQFMCAYGGSSNAAAANVAGVAALVLQANPNLTWRDLRHILITTAYQNFNESSSWILNGDNRWYSHKFGFGVPDAEAAFEMATDDYPLLANETIYEKEDFLEDKYRQINSTGYTRELNMTDHNITVFFVEVWVNITHAYRGDLKITLYSPYLTPSYFAYPSYDYYDDLINYTFSSWAHYGESCNGAWRLTISDEEEYDFGEWVNWGIRIYGIDTKYDIPPPPSPPAYVSTIPDPSPSPQEPSPSPSPSSSPSASISISSSPSPESSGSTTTTSSHSFTVWRMQSKGWFITISLILLAIFI
ncbi:neuroendocrine convertase 1 [Anaeramoeba flamelloides]|uniref:Neuroendocrine convertase 1 n=1 Tax=Anaeramoeba flamelloides TaxID=1746091 RepID=A0ABQ8X536_9EUKA|nr:neuroendocrine convertase 1 [Anaeramoeba flamelloides]